MAGRTELYALGGSHTVGVVGARSGRFGWWGWSGLVALSGASVSRGAIALPASEVSRRSMGAIWVSTARVEQRVRLVVAAALLAACGTTRDDAAPSDTASATAAPAVVYGQDSTAPPAGGGAAPLPPPPAPVRPPRDRDQAFLREMLDHHEAVLALAHDQMMAPAGHASHGTASDPGDVDAALDVEKRRMLALLDSLYGEAYSPRAAAPLTAAPGSTAAGAEHEAFQTALAAQLRAGVALVDRVRHDLRRPRVRALADSVRESQLAQLRLLGDSAASH